MSPLIMENSMELSDQLLLMVQVYCKSIGELLISATEPSSALITPAKYLQWSITNGKSAAIHSLIGFPLSKHSAVAK